MEGAASAAEVGPGSTPGASAAGLVLERYRLLERLGSGGFGVVWRARDERLEREVAVKQIPSGGAAPLERVEREARAAARLNHPGIVALYELGRDEHAVYLVFELVRGHSMSALMERRVLSDRDVARIGSVLCDALEHAHGRGVVHRDVKPDNVLVVAAPAAGGGWAKLTDFGVAYLAAGAALTATGDVLGTPAYMAPEQAEGLRATGASDVYSLGLTLYEAWTGVNPLRGQRPLDWARRVGRPLPKLRSHRRELPPALGRAVDAALDPRPDRRPSPRELRETLERELEGLDDRAGLEEAVEARTIRLDRLPRAVSEDAAENAATRLLDRLAPDGPYESPRPARALPAPRDAPPAPVERIAVAATRGEVARRSPARGLAGRAAAGAAAGALAGLALHALGAPASIDPATAAGFVALAVSVLPRLAWAAVAGALVSLLALTRPGAAAVVVPALVVAPLALPRAGTLWSAPALAPALGALALPTLFLAAAGAARTGWRRAALAAAGAAWLAAAGLLGAAPLLAYAGLPGRDWDGSVSDAVGATAPVAAALALPLAAAWAVLAWTLPLLVRGPGPVRLVGAIVWVLGAAGAHVAIGELGVVEPAPEQVVGVLAGILLAAGATAATASRRRSRAAGRARERL